MTSAHLQGISDRTPGPQPAVAEQANQPTGGIDNNRADTTVKNTADIPLPLRIFQYIGAAAVTVFALWFLFGIPAYLLFGQLFE